MAIKKNAKKAASKKRRQWVVQIREVLDNKKFADSVTKYIGSKEAKEIHKILKD